MEKVEITSMSSRGQVVIPQDVRKQLKLEAGEKFLVLGADDSILLKKIQRPGFKNFDALLKKTQEFAKKKGLKPKDVESAIKRARR